MARLEVKEGYKLVKSLFGQYEEIPKDWDLKQLSEIGNIIGGGTPDSTNPKYWDGKILWVVPGEITELTSNFITDTKRKITKKGLNNSSAKELPAGSILITSRATIGECAIATTSMTTNQGFQNLVCNKQSHNIFLFYSIKFHKKQLLRLSYGTTFLEISKNEIQKIKLPYTNDIKEQKKIASILSGVDALIESTQEVIESTTQLKKGLMQKLFTRGINNKKFKSTKIGNIPKKWGVKKIGDLFEIKTGITPSTKEPSYWNNGIINWLTPADMGKLNSQIYISGGRHKITKTALEKTGISVTPKNSILLSTRAPVGYVKILENPSAFSQSCKSLVLKNLENSIEFYAYYLIVKKSFLERISSGTTFKGLTKNGLALMQVPYAPLKEQKRIASILAEVDAYIEKNREYKKSLETLKKGLMQKLLTGKIRVKV